MENQSFILDTENLVRAGKIPVIASVILGLTYLFHIYLGYLYSPTTIFLEAFAGAMYMKSILDSSKTTFLTNIGLNGAILGGVTIMVYWLISWLSGSIISQEWSFDLLSLIFKTLEGSFVGLLGTLAWLAYKSNIN